MFNTQYTTTDGLGFTHTVVIDDMSMLKFFGGIVVTVVLLIFVHKVIK